MDRRVKERLVGASILLVLIILVVPELLSGPAPVVAPGGLQLPAANVPKPVRHVTVDLATSKPTEAASADPPLAAASGAAPGEPASAASAAANPPAEVVAPVSQASAPPDNPHPVVEAPPQSPISQASAAKSAPSSKGWSVQLGSFASRANADKLVHQLKGQGVAVYVLTSGSGAGARYRVRVGPLADRGAAVQTEAKLQALGHTGSLQPP